MTPILCAQRMHDLPKQYFATLVQRVQEARAAGHDIINIGQGNPDLPTPAHIVHALQQAGAEAQYHRYPPFRGFDFLKQAIRERYRIDYGVALDMDEIAIIGGGKTGLVQLPSIILNAGDVCALPDPGYPDYASGVAIAGGRIATMPLLQDDGYAADVRALDPPKMIVLNYPHNPTGALAPDGYYDDVIAWAATHGVLVVSDFAYGAIGDGARPKSFLASPGAKDVGIELYTMSKTYNMAGWRIGFALGNRDVIRLIEQWQDHLYVSVFGAVQAAACAALTGPQQCVDALVQTYTQRRAVWTTQTQSYGWCAPSYRAGTFFVWMPVPKGSDSTTFADRLLREAHVAVAPGIGFGACGDGHVRVALLADDTVLRTAAARCAPCWTPSLDEGRTPHAHPF